MNRIIIGGLFFFHMQVSYGQADTLGKGLYTRPKTYQGGMARVLRIHHMDRDTLGNQFIMPETYPDTIWMAWDTMLNGKQYVKLHRLGNFVPYRLVQSTPSFVAEHEGELWKWDPTSGKEYLIIPRKAPIGYQVAIGKEHTERIIDNKATFKHLGVVFENVIIVEMTYGNRSYTYYFKAGVGILACFWGGKELNFLERNLFWQQP